MQTDECPLIPSTLSREDTTDCERLLPLPSSPCTAIKIKVWNGSPRENALCSACFIGFAFHCMADVDGCPRYTCDWNLESRVDKLRLSWKSSILNLDIVSMMEIKDS